MAGQVASILGDFSATARPAPAALEVMRLSLFDWAACALAGRGEPVAGAVRRLALAEGGAPEATVVGAGRRGPARTAALVGGTTSHALDYDDTHFAHIGHPSVAVIPAALAVAERGGRDGEDMLAAALIGAEASVRVGLWLGRAHYQAGFHQTATAGSFGATLAAARLAGLSQERTAHALGLAATRASGLKSQFGTMGKPFNAGIAAANGVEAAALAEAGMVSNPAALDGAQGFGPTHAGEGRAQAWEGLGEAWLMEEVSHKFHACCHGLHAALEATAALRERAAGEEVARLSIATHPRWLSVCNIAAPATGLEAKFSYRLSAAMVLAGRDTASVAAFTDAACRDPALVALRDRVHIEADPALPESAARVTLRLADGRALCAAHDLLAPMERGEKAARLHAKAEALLGPEPAARLWAAVRPRVDLAALVRLLSG